MIQCVDHGRYHSPDWNAEPAEGAEVFIGETTTEGTNTLSAMAPAVAQLEKK